jgi:hypothetical protein
MALHAVDIRRFHKPLEAAGLVPPNCRVMEISIGVDGALMVRYEVFLTAEQTVALGGVFQQVGAEVIGERPEAGDVRA